MIRRRAATALVVGAVVLATGCSGDDAQDEPAVSDSSTSPSAPGSPSPSATPASTPSSEPQTVQILNPCTMVEPKVWHGVVPKRRWKDVIFDAGIQVFQGVRYTCQLSYSSDGADGTASWGYYLGEKDQFDMKALSEGDGRTEMAGYGFEGFTTRSLFDSRGYGLADDDTIVFVEVQEDIDAITDEIDEEGSGYTPQPAMEAMVAGLVGSIDQNSTQPALLIPDVCPGSDSPEVTALLGKVTHGRGASQPSAESCSYWNNKDQVSLALDIVLSDGPSFQQTYDEYSQSPPGSNQILDPAPGRLVIGTCRDDGGCEVTVLEPGKKAFFQANVSNQARKRIKIDLDDVVALMDVYLKMRLPALPDAG